MADDSFPLLQTDKNAHQCLQRECTEHVQSILCQNPTIFDQISGNFKICIYVIDIRTIPSQLNAIDPFLYLALISFGIGTFSGKGSGTHPMSRLSERITHGFPSLKPYEFPGPQSLSVKTDRLKRQA